MKDDVELEATVKAPNAEAAKKRFTDKKGVTYSNVYVTPRKGSSGKKRTKKTQYTRQVMCSKHPRWLDFIKRLARLDDALDPQTRTCGRDCPLATRIMREMGFSPDDIEVSIAYFQFKGSTCDCGIVLNVDKF